jgi:hypothetical protein
MVWDINACQGTNDFGTDLPGSSFAVKISGAAEWRHRDESGLRVSLGEGRFSPKKEQDCDAAQLRRGSQCGHFQ